MDDPKELGRRISAARGYAQESKTAFARRMGRSVPTIDRWESGEAGSVGRTIPQRRQLAAEIIEATGCPVAFFDLERDGAGELRRLRQELEEELQAARTDRLATLGAVEEQRRALEGLRRKVDRAERERGESGGQTRGAER